MKARGIATNDGRGESSHLTKASSKKKWIALGIVVPLAGLTTYLLLRPPSAEEVGRRAIAAATRGDVETLMTVANPYEFELSKVGKKEVKALLQEGFVPSVRQYEPYGKIVIASIGDGRGDAISVGQGFRRPDGEGIPLEIWVHPTDSGWKADVLKSILFAVILGDQPAISDAELKGLEKPRTVRDHLRLYRALKAKKSWLESKGFFGFQRQPRDLDLTTWDKQLERSRSVLEFQGFKGPL